MEEIYVPKDFSTLNEILPSDEEILYSTLCTLRFSYMGFTDLGRRVKRRVKYNSHVLITARGLAYFCRPIDVNKKPSELIDLEPEPRYNTILNIFDIKGKSFKVLHSDYTQRETAYDFELIRHPNFETEETFTERVKRFKMVIIPNKLNAAESLLLYIINNKEKEVKEDSPLWKVNKENFSSNKFVLGPEEIHKSPKFLDRFFKIAYIKYKIKRGKIRSSLGMRRLYNYSIFDDEYIRQLKKIISKHKKYLNNENKT